MCWSANEFKRTTYTKYFSKGGKMDFFSVIKEGIKALQKKPILLLIYLTIFLVLYFASKVAGSNPPILVQLAFFLLALLVFFGLLIFLIGSKNRFPRQPFIDAKEYEENEIIHKSVGGEWNYEEEVQDKSGKKAKVKGKILVNALDDWQFSLDSEVQKSTNNQNWASIHSGWVGEKIFG
jgi:hypothetical protein